jgi:hypothetical protein
MDATPHRESAHSELFAEVACRDAAEAALRPAAHGARGPGQPGLAPAALAVGFARSFATIGAFVAIFGFGTDVFGMVADLMLMLAGGILPIPAVQTGLAGAAGPVSGWTDP